MDLSILAEYFSKYGMIVVFVIVLLEYCNLPGFPAGIILPFAGVMAANGKTHFLLALLVTVLAGLVGSWILYYLGLKGGDVFLNAYIKKFPKQEETIQRYMEWIRKKGCIGVFVAKLLPMIRTIISIPAGVIKMNFVRYTISSTLGIVVWNFVFVGAGYILGDAVFTMFA